MEPYIKNNANDITYQSERSPFLAKERGGINSSFALLEDIDGRF